MKANDFFKDETPEHVAMFEELCHRAGTTLKDLDLPGDGKYHWPYEKYTWTEGEEADFGKWLVEYMWKNRKKLEMGYVTKKRMRDYEVPFWILMYGWKYT